MASTTENNLTEPIAGTLQRRRLGLAGDSMEHFYDDDGQMVEYLCMNGSMPPASR